jgi:hypothetical protein
LKARSFQKTERPDFRPANPLRTNFSLGAAPQTYALKSTHRTLHFCTVNTITLPEGLSPASHQYWLQMGIDGIGSIFGFLRRIVRAKQAGKNLAEEKTPGIFSDERESAARQTTIL